MMKQCELAPKWLAKKVGPHPEGLLEGRIISRDMQFSGFMASYGSQHTIPIGQLKEKGLQTMIMRDEWGLRYFSPWEMISALGYSESTVLPTNIVDAWRMAGNGISVGHVILHLYKTHVMMGSESPFSPNESIENIVASIRRQTIRMSAFETFTENNWWKLKPCHNESEVKRCKTGEDISPTIPYPLDPYLVEGGEPWEMKVFESAPGFQHVDDPRQIATNCGRGGVVALRHAHKHWMMVVNCEPRTKVESIVIEGLPHAKAKHFDHFVVNGQHLQWDEEVLCKNLLNITFHPKMEKMTIIEESLKLSLEMMIDVTWSTKTALAVCATLLGCNIDALRLSFEGLRLKDDDFVIEYETSQLDMSFKACTPGAIQLASVATSVKDPGMAPAPCDFHMGCSTSHQ